MKRIFKMLSALVVAFVMLLAMTSCSGYSFYDDWHKAGAEITKENVFEVITLDQAKEKKEKGDVFALLYANSTSYESVSLVTRLQNQAEYLSASDVKIYFVNSASYNTKEKRNEVRAAINMHDVPDDGSPIIMTFKNKAVDVDTSNTNKVSTKRFISDSGLIEYASLASYIFRELK